MRYRLTQRETKATWFEHKEEFNTLEEAQERMMQMYHDIAINGAELVESAGYKDMESWIELEDHNVVSMIIEEI